MTVHPCSMISSNVISIIDWNVAGELHIPKNITVGSNNPLFVLRAAFHSSPCLIQKLLYPHHTSILEKYLAPFNLSISSDISGNCQGTSLAVCTPLYTLLIIHIPPSFYFAYNHLLLFGYDLNLSCSQ